MRQFGEKTYLGIKAACRKLVDRAGGPQQVARLTRANQGHISSAISPNELERFMAIDQVADLEAEIGDPLVTRHLAEMAGFNLEAKTPLPDEPMPILQHFAHVVSECSDVQRELASRLADGSLDDRDRAMVAEQAREAIDALQKLLNSMAPKPTVVRRA